MPARSTHFRAIKDEFRSFLDQREERWPKYSTLLRELKKEKGGSRATIVEMKSGAVVPQKYVRCLVRVMMESKGQVLDEFLATHGIADRNQLTVDQLVEIVAKPLQLHPAPAASEVDWHLKGLKVLGEIFVDSLWQRLVHPETLCHDEADVDIAISMIMSSVGRQVYRGRGHISDDQAIATAEQFMRISHSNYLARAIDLWRISKWTFAFATIGRQRVACMCILPLKPSAYEEIRSGSRITHSCVGVDLIVPAHTLFLEAVGHRSDAEYAFFGRKTIQAIKTIYVQLAALSVSEGTELLHDGGSLRILSMAGDKLNERRLKSAGFRHTGTRMPEFNIPFMEMDERKAWLTPLIVGKLQERLLESGEGP